MLVNEVSYDVMWHVAVVTARSIEAERDRVYRSVCWCRRGDKVVHVKIKRDEEGLAVEGGETFATLPELIHSYANGHEQLSEKNGHEIVLKLPLQCSDPTNER